VSGNGEYINSSTMRPSGGGISAAEREQQRLVYIAAVDNIARAQRLTAREVDRLTAENRELLARLDAVERGATVLSAWVRRPWWERMRSRFGV
jgi:hypothetical protein